VPLTRAPEMADSLKLRYAFRTENAQS
jgi:hypothetical protein